MKQHTTFYIVRHGETEWNVKELLQGQKDSNLTAKGKEQARNVAKELSHIPFEAIYSSDLKRAKETAAIIAMERKIEVLASKLLRERNFGPFEGKPARLLKEYDDAIMALTEKERFFYKNHPDVESDEELISRFTAFLREIVAQKKGENILLVTHGGMMRAFLIYTGHETHESLSFKTSKITNSAYIELRTDGEVFEVVRTVGIEKKQA